MKEREKYSFRYNLLLLLFGLLAGLLLLELGVFLYDQAASYIRSPARIDYLDDPDNIRLAVLGGSTAAGWPYCDNGIGYNQEGDFNLLSFVEFFLEERCNQNNIVIDNYADAGLTAGQAVSQYLRKVRWKPDVLVLCTGHNEIFSNYSPNVVIPFPELSFLQRFHAGRKFLHYLFHRRVLVLDKQYRGNFFREDVIPPYEIQQGKIGFREAVERIIRHCREYDIFLIVVIPEGNYLNPPNSSIYQGPAARRAEAEGLFKLAFYQANFGGKPGPAAETLKTILEFCSFSHAYFEMGMLCYQRGEFEQARDYLRRAIDSDGYPLKIDSEYRRILREVAHRHGVAVVDMNELIRREIGSPVPDYSCFWDGCHPKPEVFKALAVEIIRIIGNNLFSRLVLPEVSLDIGESEMEEKFRFTPDNRGSVSLAMIDWHFRWADCSFLKIRQLSRALRIAEEARGLALSPEKQAEIDRKTESVETRLEQERERVRSWAESGG